MIKRKKGCVPKSDSLSACLAISSATNEVATLSRGILNTFDTILKIDMDTPADANSNAPLTEPRT